MVIARLRFNGCDHVTPVRGIKQGRLADMSVMSRGWGHWGHWGHAHAPAPGPLMSLNVTRCHCDTLIGRERSRDLDTGLWLADVTTMPGAPGATLGLVTLGPSLRVSLDQHNHQVRGEIRSRMKGLFRSENSRPSPKSQIQVPIQSPKSKSQIRGKGLGLGLIGWYYNPTEMWI